MNSDLKEIIETRIRLLNFDADDLANKIESCDHAKSAVEGDHNKMMYYRIAATRASGLLDQINNELEFLNLLVSKFNKPGEK